MSIHVSLLICFSNYITVYITIILPIILIISLPLLLLLILLLLGTTVLHELLGLHPDVKTHTSWEQTAPCPDMSLINSYSSNSNGKISSSSSSSYSKPSEEDFERERRVRHKVNKPFFDFFLQVGGK